MSAATTPAPFGWIWLDDGGWEHNASEQHPHERGEAEGGEQFRPATAEEAASPDFFRCPEGSHGAVAPAQPSPPSTAPDAIVPKWAGRRVP